MNINQIIKLEIIDMANTGAGIGRYQNIAVFVDGALKGDTVKAKITKIKKNYLQAYLVEVVTPSEKRVDKICPISHLCGGCQILELDYKEQIALKKDIVAQNLKRIGKIENPQIDETIGMEKPYNYRNKTQIPIGIENGEIVAGFYQSKSHRIIPFDTCYIQDSINDKIIKIVKNYIKTQNIPVYNEQTHKGVIRHIVTRISHATGQIMVILVTNQKNPLKNIDSLYARLSDAIPNLSSLIQNINTKNTNTIMGDSDITLYGKEYIVDKIGDLEFEIYPQVFYQVNSIQMEKLYKKALEYCSPSKDDVVYDLYCGIGTISLLFARKCKKVYGIEMVEDSVKSAIKNAKRNNIDNAEFLSGKVEDEILNLAKTKQKPDIIVLDPARKGCEKIVIDTIIKIAPRKILYISCNPATLARDINIIKTSEKYTIDSITPVDMFPHTMHVECIALMSRK